MSWQEDAVARIDTLIHQGENVPIKDREYGTADYARYYAWRTRALVALQQIVGADNTYAKEFEHRASAHASGGNRDAGVAILHSLRDDIQAAISKK